VRPCLVDSPCSRRREAGQRLGRCSSADRAQPVNVPVAELGIELGVSSVIRRFRTDHRAAAVLEYALIAGLISILVVVGATTIGTKLSSHYYGPIAVGLS